MTTDTALALLAEEADAEVYISFIPPQYIFTPRTLAKFAALIQQQMEAENAEPVAWMNPENGVVIDARKKLQIGEGSGYPKFSIPLYAAIDRARSANERI